jgi:hypothetical protein
MLLMSVVVPLAFAQSPIFSPRSGCDIPGMAIDGDIDETREFLLQDLLLSGSLTGIGYVSGVGAATREEPRYNYTLDPYYTDGLRLVLFMSKDYASPDDVEFVPWNWPGEAASVTPE